MMKRYIDAPKEYGYGYAQEYMMRAQLPDGSWTKCYAVIAESDCYKEWSARVEASETAKWLSEN